MEHQAWKWLGIDHITYAVWDIAAWRAIYIDCFGFKEIHHTADACPHGASSMELYGLESGNSRIALVSPISRTLVSHVEHFLNRHGDHSVQHVAYSIQNLEEFVEEMTEKKFRFLGKVKIRNDAFGSIKQIFAKRFDAYLTPAQGVFYEFVERSEEIDRGVLSFFSSRVAEELYDDVERDMHQDDGAQFIDLTTVYVE